MKILFDNRQPEPLERVDGRPRRPEAAPQARAPAEPIQTEPTQAETAQRVRRRRRLDGGLARRAARLRVAACKLGRAAVRIGGRVLKRGADVVGSAALIVATAPITLLVAALIKLTDGGPVLFWQTRVGRHGRLFPFPKFRSMVIDAERLKAALLEQNDHDASITFKMKRDPRVTWIGRIIRRLSIDELPQAWCVLRGDMTLVGPRPPVPSEVQHYTVRDRRRLEVTPGLTCIWQVSGRGDVPFAEQVEMDVDYIERQSLALDLSLLVRTVTAVLSGKGAY